MIEEAEGIKFEEWKKLSNSERIRLAVSNDIDRSGLTDLLCPNNYVWLKLETIDSKTLRFICHYKTCYECKRSGCSSDTGFFYSYHVDWIKKPHYFMSINKINWLKKRNIDVLKFWDFLEEISYPKRNPTFKELEILIKEFRKEDD